MVPGENDWLSKNVKWLLPVGCLALFAIALAVVVTLMAVIFGLLRSSEVVEIAFERASDNSVVRKNLGQPIEMGWIVSGTISIEGPRGEADLSIPISGPSGRATVHL